MVRTRFQRPTSALRLRRDVRVEFERARAGRVEEAARQTTVPVERVRRARFVARRAADVLVCDLFTARRADESDAKERGLLGRVQHVAARQDVILRQSRDLAAVLISGAEGRSNHRHAVAPRERLERALIFRRPVWKSNVRRLTPSTRRWLISTRSPTCRRRPEPLGGHKHTKKSQTELAYIDILGKSKIRLDSVKRTTQIQNTS